jgi:hypothetical protein
VTEAQKFRKKSLSPYFKLFLLAKLPLAFIAGIKMDQFNESICSTALTFRWINQNPFKSMYFAAMQMAAELCTGLLLFQHLNSKAKFSMLLVSVKSNFTQKAIGKIRFMCEEGDDAAVFINEVLNNAEGVSKVFKVNATNSKNEEVANFEFTWSCKKK